MTDWPPQITTPEPPGVILSTGLSTMCGDQTILNRAASSASAIGTANRAFYTAFFLEYRATVFKISWTNGATVNGNVDVGIYDETLARLVSSGAVAQTGTTTIQTADITDTVLQPGLYYMAMSSSSATSTFWRMGVALAGVLSICGVAQQETAHVLPATAAFTAASSTVPTAPPLMALNLRPEMG